MATIAITNRRSRVAGVLERSGDALMAGGVLFSGLYGLLSLSSVIEPLDVLETHWLFHMLGLPVMALLAAGTSGLYRRQRDAGRMGKFDTTGASMATWGFTVGGIIAEATIDNHS